MGKTTKKTIESVKEEIKLLSNGEYEVVSDIYKNNEGELIIRHHMKDGTFHDYKSSRKAFVNRNNRCPKCNTKRLKTTNPNFKSFDIIKEEFKSIVGNSYEILTESSEYKNNKQKLLIRHFVNGSFHDFEMRYNDFTNGHRCSICSGRKKKTQKEFEQEVEKLGKGEYKVNGKYINNRTHIELLHLKCNKIWNVRPDDFTNGFNRCPYCAGSNGEQIIMRYLEEKNYNYTFQYIYQDCKFIRPLPFDFKVIANNNHFMIEFDGVVHFKPIYGKDELKKKQRNDEIKNNYCKDNNIPLLRIKYTDIKNIDTLIENFVDKLNSCD